MRDRSSRQRPVRHRAGAAILATALLSGGLVAATTNVTSAAPVNTTIQTSCGPRAGHKPTADALEQAKLLLGSNRLAVTLEVTAADIPESAGIDQEINATFGVKARLDQNLIDKGAPLIPSIPVNNISGTMLVKGPSSVESFTGTAPNVVVKPVAGQPAVLNLGNFGGPITTTGGGIITYRVGSIQFDSSLTIPSVGLSFNLQLQCGVTGSNLVAKTSVKDPDAPVFNPEIIPLTTNTGGTVTADLLGDNISPGKTPLLPETLKIVEPPASGTATLTNGVFSFTAPDAPGTYSTTVEVCGAPKDESGTPGINDNQLLQLGANWPAKNMGGGLPLLGDGLLPRPLAFSLKVGTEETRLIWTSQHILSPVASFPLPGKTPDPAKWAPESAAGQVNDYAPVAKYTGVSAADVQSALEALPSVGAGNVVVTEVKANEAKPNLVTGLDIEFVNGKGEQDVDDVKVGQWYSVPPQEALDRIQATISELTTSLQPEPGAPEAPPALTDKQIGDKLLASLVGGPAVTDEEWSAWLMSKLNLGELVPAISTFLNGLFPNQIEQSTIEQGEAGTPPQQLCAQAIVDVTVTEVLVATTLPPGTGPQVGGTSDTRGGAGIGFVG